MTASVQWLNENKITLSCVLVGGYGLLLSAQGDELSVVEQKRVVHGAEPEPRDLTATSDGEPLFVSPLYSCIAKENCAEIAPVWRPRFISAIKPEDRCHLNGMAVCDGKPAYVTAFADTDAKSGWRARPDGIVIDVESGEIICRGLSMPHSPRIHDGKLWVLNSGSGEIGIVDAGSFHPIARCPGFLRGLDFIGDYAVIGSSIPRGPFFVGLPMHLRTRAASRCGIYVLNTRSGEVEHSLHFSRSIIEMYELKIRR